MVFDPYRLIHLPTSAAAEIGPEWVQRQSIAALRAVGQRQPAAAALQETYSLRSPRLTQRLWGLQFNNPVGLAAGFDKDGLASRAWHCLGFGFAELGTVTRHPQPGNPTPRLFRLAADRAAINRMGFNNRGAAALADTLKGDWGQQPHPIPLGLNIGKSKRTPLEAAAQDYGYSFGRLQPLGEYVVVNVSSPNTPGLRSLQAVAQLKPILAALMAANTAGVPVLVKLSPDLAWEDLAAVLDLAQSLGIAGVIATNTTLNRDHLITPKIRRTGQLPRDERGGLSGAPLRSRSTEVIRFIHRYTSGSLPIIGVGGIFTAADAWEKITAGASLVQVYTGWIYQGPGMVRQLLAGLLQRLDGAGLQHISEAVGLADRCGGKSIQ
ncbi:MAG: quinone-dependent dihydroorotate dehydrogenase [Cyanobacteria bacterium P01_A01_bin.135]